MNLAKALWQQMNRVVLAVASLAFVASMPSAANAQLAACNAALDILGAEGTLRPGNEGAPVGGRFERSYRYTVVDTIGGGASEIQKNIIARRKLGLPKNF